MTNDKLTNLDETFFCSDGENFYKDTQEREDIILIYDKHLFIYNIKITANIIKYRRCQPSCTKKMEVR